MGGLLDTFYDLENRYVELLDDVMKLENENIALSNRLRTLERRSVTCEQQLRGKNIEIVGLPDTDAEDIFHLLEMLAAFIETPYRREDIYEVYRSPFYRQHEHPPVIVKFASQSAKDAWMSAARNKDIDSTQIDPMLPSSQVYIRHHLTVYNKMLLSKARRLVRKNQLVHAGFAYGRVFIILHNGDVYKVSHIEDLGMFDDFDSSQDSQDSQDSLDSQDSQASQDSEDAEDHHEDL